MPPSTRTRRRRARWRPPSRPADPAAPRPSHRRRYPAALRAPSLALALLLAAAAAGQAPPATSAAATASATPASVLDAVRTLEAARAALRASRSGLEAEVLLRPELDLVARDDPPRPLEADLAWRPEATLSWAPLASEILLAEARVLEAERALVDARREDVARRLRLPVERARALAALEEARRALRTAREEAAAADAAWAEAAAASAAADRDARGEAEGPERRAALERDLRDKGAKRREARLDGWDAELDLLDAEREARALGATAGPRSAAGIGAHARAPERPDLIVPDAVPVRTLRAYRARERRLAASVGVARRRRVDAFLPAIGVEAGYAGADARTWIGVELDSGRPRAELGAAWTGTPQERAWATLSASVRLGSDAAAAHRKVDAAREEAWRTLAVLAAELEADGARRLAEAGAARARWLLAEARLEAAAQAGDAAAVPRAEDVARRDWLRFLKALERAAAVLEAPIVVAPAVAAPDDAGRAPGTAPR